VEIVQAVAPAGQGTSTQLVVTPHPLTRQNQTSISLLWANETLLEVVRPHGVNASWVVCIGGIEVPAHYWSRVRVKHGQVIECRRRVHGDAISGLFKLVAVAALLYFTFGAGGAFTLAGFSGLSGAALTFAQMALFQGGMLLINKLLPGKQADTTRDTPQNVPTYSLTGNGNRTRPWAPMAIVFGEPYVVPDLGSQPYTYFFGGDQYLAQIFHGGINCASVSQIKIGETLISDYTDVQLYSDGLHQAGYNGMPSGSVDAIAGAVLDAPTAPGAWVVRTTSINTLSAVVEFEALLYTVEANNGAYQEAACELDIQYRAAGAANWIDRPTPPGETYATLQDVYGSIVTGGRNPTETYGVIRQDRVNVPVPNGKIILRNASAKTLRTSYNLSLGQGQWEIRIRKTTANSTSSNSQNAVTWTQLRSYQQDLASYPGEARLGVVIKASGQLNGAIDQLNWIAKAKPMAYWSGSDWTAATSAANGLSNPGAQILLLARGVYDSNNSLVAGLGWADSRIDIESLKRFMVWCAAKGFTHNFVQQENISLFELMTNIAAVGLGRMDWADGRLGVTFLSDAAPIECVVNMANMKAKTFSVSYPLASRADELEYGFFDAANSNTWKSLRVLAPGVTNPVRTARMNNAGVTTEAHAAIMARFQMAANIYMGKSITFDLDMEYLSFGINTVIALSHDLTQWGYGGRVQSVVNNAGILTLGLDDAIPAGSSSRYIGLRLLGEQQYRIFGVNAFSGTARSVTLSTAWPAGVPVPGTNSQAMDALWVYDFKATPGAKCVVTSIEPAGTESAKITVVPLADEFWPYVLSGSYTPPPNISLLSTKPVASNVQVTETLRKNGLSYIVDLQIRFDLVGSFSRAELWGALSTGAVQKLADTTTSQEFVYTVALKESWYFEVRPFNVLGQGAVASASYLVQGLSIPPETPIGFLAQITANGVQLMWAQSIALDYVETIVKSGETWSNGVTITTKSSTTHLLGWLPSGLNYFQIKHVDCIGNESIIAAKTAITISAPASVSITRCEVQANSVSVAWSDAKTSQPIKSYAYYTADGLLDFAQAKLYGKAGSDGRNDIILFNSSGKKRIWILAEDLAGNIGIASSFDVTITMPSNFKLLSKYDALIGRDDANLTVVSDNQWETLYNDGDVYDAVGTSLHTPIFCGASWDGGVAFVPSFCETWEQHFSRRGWLTSQDQINAGYPYYFQPSATGASIKTIGDVGTTLVTGAISVTPVMQVLQGSVQGQVQIATSVNLSGPWTDFGNGLSEVLASNFRYIKTTYSITASGGDDLAVVSSILVQVRLEPKTEIAAMTISASDPVGTMFTTTLGFNDITGVGFDAASAALGEASEIWKADPYWDDNGAPAISPRIYVLAFDKNGNRVSGAGTITIHGV